MKKADITIRQRKDGTFEARATIDGKRYSRYGKSTSEAKAKMKALLQESNRNNVIAVNNRLAVLMESYLENVKKAKVKPSTYDRVENVFKYHIKNERIGRLQLSTITSEDIQKHLLDKCKGLSESSVKKIYSLLSEFFKYAVGAKLIGYNPMQLVTIPHSSNFKVQTKEMAVLTVEEMQRVISVAESVDKKGNPLYRYGEAVVLLLVTGMRCGELCAIHESDIDIESKVLYVRHTISTSKDREKECLRYEVSTTKTKSSTRMIPLNDRAVLAIQRLLKTTYSRESGYLVCTKGGVNVTHCNLQRCYSLILKKAGVKDMGLHSTRHTFATVVLKDAEDKGQIKEVSELLGHSQVSTTYQYYIKTSDEDKRTLLNQLDNLVKKVG